MRLTLTTELSAPPERVWNAVLTSRLLEHVAHPIVRFRPANPDRFPDVWSDGVYDTKLVLFGFIPAGHQLIRISRSVTGQQRVLRDDGTGALAARWDHIIRVEPSAAGGTLYTDDVDVRAGMLTLFVWLFAQGFYRYRQSRWRALVARNFEPLGNPLRKSPA